MTIDRGTNLDVHGSVMPRVFVSAVTSELGTYRLAARDVLARMNIEPVVQDHFATDYRSIIELLREQIARSDAVLSLVGFRFGAEPKDRPDSAPRRSYTQLEYDIARDLGKPIYRMLLRDGNATSAPAEDDECRRLQLEHRAALLESDEIYYEFASLPELWRHISETSLLAPVTQEQFIRPLPGLAQHLLGRQETLNQLDDAWYDPGLAVVSLVAWGGVGKTSLLAHWVRRLRERRWLGAERVFVWPFHGQGGADGNLESSDLFLQQALAFFGETGADYSTIPPRERAEHLAALIAARRSLLILDAVEGLQDPPGPAGGRLRDVPLRIVLEHLAENGRGLCVVTSRQSLRDLAPWGASTSREWPLEALERKSAIELLRLVGVKGTEDELAAANDEVGGHPLTLELLGRYLAAAHGGDVRRRRLVALGNADARMLDGQAGQVMQAYERWLRSSTGDGARQLAVLRLLGLFDRPADESLLATLRALPRIDGLCDALDGCSEDEWNITIANLEAAHLVLRNTEEAGPILGFGIEQAERARSSRHLGAPELFAAARQVSTITAHPLVRDYFANRLRSDAPEAFRAGHQRLYRSLAASVPYWPEGLDGLAPLYQAVFHGSLAEAYTEARASIYRDRIQRSEYGTGYSSGVLGVAGSDLAAVQRFFSEPWGKPHPSLPVEAQAWVLRDAAFNLEATGRSSEALNPLRQSLRLTVEHGQWLGAAVRASDLSRLELSLGQIEPAIESARSAQGFCGRRLDQLGRSAGLLDSLVTASTHLADALAQIGEHEEALQIFHLTEAFQREHARARCLFSLSGFLYCDLLLAESERAAWRAFGAPGDADSAMATALQTLPEIMDRGAIIHDIGLRSSVRLDRALGALVMARVHLHGALLSGTAATTYLARALESADEAVQFASGTTPDYIRSLLCRSWVHHAMGDPGRANGDLDRAWSLACSGPFELRCVDIEIYRARLLRDRSALDRAAKQVARWRYKRRLAELGDTLALASTWA